MNVARESLLSRSLPSYRRLRPRRPWAYASVGLLTLLLSFYAAFSIRYSERVYPGVSVLGVELGGLSRSEAVSAVRAEAAKLQAMPISLQYGDRAKQLRVADLGMSINVPATVETAYSQGRRGSVPTRWAARLMHWARPVDLQPALTLDQRQARSVVTAFAAQVNRPVRNAALLVDGAGPRLAPSQTGLEVDTDATLDRLPASVAEVYRTSSAVDPVVRVSQPAVTEAQLKAAYDSARTAWNRPVVLRFGGREWQWSTAAVRDAIAVKGVGAAAAPTLEPAAVEAWVRAVARDVDRSPINASIAVTPGSVAVVKDQDGYRLDVAATARNVSVAAFSATGAVQAQVSALAPTVRAADLAPAAEAANAMVSRPIVLTAGSSEWTLTTTELTSMLLWSGSGADQRAKLDTEALRRRISKIAASVDRRPVNARIALRNERYVARPDVAGITVAVDESAAAVEAGAQGSDRRVAIVTRTTSPAVRTAHLRAAVAEANRLSSVPLRVAFGVDSWTVSPATLRTWLEWTGSGRTRAPQLSSAAVGAYAQSLAADLNADPQNAYIATDGGVALIPERAGIRVDVPATADALYAALNQGTAAGVVAEQIAPAVTADSLRSAYEQARAYAGERLYLIVQDKTWWLDPGDLARTLVWSGSGSATTVSLDVSAMEAQLRSWLPSNAAGSAVIQYGATARAAVSALENGEHTLAVVLKAPAPTGPAQHKGNEAYWNGAFPDKWIDINLTTQSMAAYEGSRQVRVSLITSGRPELPTPTGRYEVIAQLRDYVFRSPWPKESEWWYPDSPTNFALRFRYGGLYIHDAPWRTEYGPGTNGSGKTGDARTGSHGCVNVPYSMMVWMFSWSQIGTPILIHY